MKTNAFGMPDMSKLYKEPSIFESNKSKKSGSKTLGERDKGILHKLAKKKCENCGIKLDYKQMQAGHKLARAKGHKASLKNSVCLCWSCNRDQGTDSWKTFRKKQNKPPTSATDHLKSTKRKLKTRRKPSPQSPFEMPKSGKGGGWGF